MMLGDPQNACRRISVDSLCVYVSVMMLLHLFVVKCTLQKASI